MEGGNETDISFFKVAELTIRLGVLLGLVVWCFFLLDPFGNVIVWSAILSMTLHPFYSIINRNLHDRPKIAASIVVFCGLVIIIVPGVLVVGSMVEEVHSFKAYFTENGIRIPPPPESLVQWPFAGRTVYEIWLVASTNLESLIIRHQDQIARIIEKVLAGMVSIGGSVFQFVLAFVIAGFLLVSSGIKETVIEFFRRVSGSKGDEYAKVVFQTTGNVAKGVFGVAIIQSTAIGIGFFIANVPNAGFWTFCVLLLAILQVPALVVVIPMAIYLFSVKSTTIAILWTIYLMFAGLSYIILKPKLLGISSPAPAVVIFIGGIGGLVLSGFIGMFTGAIMLSLGYQLIVSWLNDSH